MSEVPLVTAYPCQLRECRARAFNVQSKKTLDYVESNFARTSPSKKPAQRCLVVVQVLNVNLDVTRQTWTTTTQRCLVVVQVLNLNSYVTVQTWITTTQRCLVVVQVLNLSSYATCHTWTTTTQRCLVVVRALNLNSYVTD